MGKEQPIHVPDRRGEILDAAEAVFGLKGYAATTMEEVADRTTLSKGSIYNYFQSKRDLFHHVFIRAIAEQDAATTAIFQADTSAAHKIEAILDYWFQRLEELKGVVSLAVEFWATAAREGSAGETNRTFRELYRQWGEKLASVLRDGRDAGEFSPDLNIPVGASLIMAILDGIEVESVMDIGLIVNREFVDALKHAILAALTARVNPLPASGEAGAE